MMIGPEPRIRILEMSVRLGIYLFFLISVIPTKWGSCCFFAQTNSRSLDSASFTSRTICSARDDTVLKFNLPASLAQTGDACTTSPQDLPTSDLHVQSANLS